MVDGGSWSITPAGVLVGTVRAYDTNGEGIREVFIWSAQLRVAICLDADLHEKLTSTRG